MSTIYDLSRRPAKARLDVMCTPKPGTPKFLSRGLRRLVMWLLLLLPAVGMSDVADVQAELQQEWLEIQASKDRQRTKRWWQHVDALQIDAFLEAGVEVNVAGKRGWTPVHSAARYNPNPDVLLALLHAGALVDARTRSGDTPLHWAAAENANVEIITALIEAGADVNARDKFGWLPIHTAAESNSNPDVIDTLLAAGSKRKKRAYFVLFRPAFLLKHNANMSEPDKKVAMALLKEPR